ncbi:predicted protein [Lichtheimia corymbifera JMRC:FSU:9682]|uniref:RRM Nup35-type domain-containing protein n=1 Tax=Lichtheimia corymbifera JMRC:FSU:9682 TaxID=1263082 RepID=A0A068S318_9FUNG|nr:predicted protein [Lichtheimia corymbifera JMRC:FSU:9682]
MPAPPKPLFKTVDTTTSRSSNSMFCSTASSSSSSIPSSLQPKQDFKFNSMPNIANGSQQQKPPHRAVSWNTPPSFFVTSKSSDSLSAMDTEPTESYNVAFGEGKSIMSLNDTEAAGKYAGNKRESISTFGNERRVSFKASKEASVDKGKGVEEPSRDDENESKINVFGFAPDSKQAILDHFSKFGKILEHESKGNWIMIRYASRDSAQQSLESNGKAIAGDHIIGVTTAASRKRTTSEESIKPTSTRIVPFGQAKDLYKKPEAKKPVTTSPGGVTLGSGKVGLSVLGCPSITPSGDITLVSSGKSITSNIKELLFEW